MSLADTYSMPSTRFSSYFFFCRGLLSVGVVTSCYLIRGDVILDPKTKPSYVLPDDVPLDINSDILFSDSMSGHDIDLFASNRYDFGHLLL